MAFRSHHPDTGVALSKLAQEEWCEGCDKPKSVCICDRIEVFKKVTIPVVVLQHPQETRNVLSTTPLIKKMLPSAEIVTGLSWRSLEHVLSKNGKEAAVDPSRWWVLFPKSASDETKGEPPPSVGDTPAQKSTGHNGAASKGSSTKGTAEPQGILVIDGTWSQAKSLWWRNAWLLKLARTELIPREPSIYGSLRKEPRAGAVSSLEAVADALVLAGVDPEVRVTMRKTLRTLVQRIRDRINGEQPKQKA